MPVFVSIRPGGGDCRALRPLPAWKLVHSVASRDDQNVPMWRALCPVLFLALSLTPALAEVRIEASPGGEATSFIEFFEQLRRSHQRVVIDGPCFSACTLVLVIIPQSRICVTRRAVFGFHAARAVDEFGRRLSRADPQLDQASRRAHAHAHLSQRPRACGHGSALPIEVTPASVAAYSMSRSGGTVIARSHRASGRTPV